jgi:hypothetical protein
MAIDRITATNALDFCGWGRVDAKTPRERVLEAARMADDVAALYAKPFFIAGQAESGAGKCARLHKAVEKVTGKPIRIDPQGTGDCVAASSRVTLILRTCVEILGGELEKYRWLFSPFHYATGRVLIGKNRLRGGAGSIGGWQAEANAKYGFLAADDTGGLTYSKGIADAWGDDRKFQNKSFRDFMEIAKPTTLQTWARMQAWNEVRDGLFHGYPQTIGSNRGYTMKPDASGFHRPSGTWPHQLTIYAYWENVKTPCVAIVNTWDDVHGITHDPETGEELPRGTILVRLEDFTKHHLTSSAECIAYSSVDGFDAKIDWSEFF